MASCTVSLLLQDRTICWRQVSIEWKFERTSRCVILIQSSTAAIQFVGSVKGSLASRLGVCPEALAGDSTPVDRCYKARTPCYIPWRWSLQCKSSTQLTFSECSPSREFLEAPAVQTV
jgi:hypothetical protein